MQFTGILSTACHSYPQSAYCGLSKSLQHEWAFVQRVNQCESAAFTPLEAALAETFLPCLFKPPDPDGSQPALAVARPLTALPVKAGGLGVSNPTTTTTTSHEASLAMAIKVSTALVGSSTTPFSLAEHEAHVSATRLQTQTARATDNQQTLAAIIAAAPDSRREGLSRACHTGAWLSVIPMPENDTVLSPLEFRDSLHLRYGLAPPDLPSHCDGCKKWFGVHHTFSCTHGGLLLQRHTQIVRELADLSAMAFIPSAVRDEPRITIGRPALAPIAPTDSSHAPTPSDPVAQDRGDLLVRGFWHRGTDCIFDVSLVDVESPGRRDRGVTAEKALSQREKAKKTKYLALCTAQRRHFTPFVVSTDGLFAPEAQAVLQRLSQLLAQKWSKPYSVVRSFANARLSIALARSATLCLRGSRVPASTMSRSRLWDDVGALDLFYR